MKRTVLIAGVFLCAGSIFALARPAHTQALSLTANEDKPTVAVASTPFLEASKVDTTKAQAKPEPTKAEPPKPVEHIVQPGESLSTIATQYQTTWNRIYNKNTALTNPDIIDVNQHLIIPNADEVLPERAVQVDAPVEAQAEAPQPAAAKAPSAKTAATKPAPVSYAAGSSNGNSYSRGYCTWYAKNRRPDLPNNLGNAISWVSRAAAQGIATGSTPRAGAVGQSGNHVVFVESVNGDGTITVSEMNWKGVGVISSRTTSAGAFSYIY